MPIDNKNNNKLKFTDSGKRKLLVRENIGVLIMALVVVIFIAIVLTACGDDDDAVGSNSSSSSSEHTGNDHVLKEDAYQEYFKQEGTGDKNYLYTETEFDNSIGQHCTVVTGHSERWGTISCINEDSNGTSLLPPSSEESGG